ncbi:MAG: hypothetical protein QM784_29395 [Polyangiaceae bacterium]
MTCNLVITDKLVRLAWQQWSALGVAGSNACDTVAIDLEALLLLTGVVSDFDPRLRDEALDWCSKCGHLISKPRLKQLLSAAASETRDAFGEFAGTLGSIAEVDLPGADKARALGVRLSGKSQLADLSTPALFNLRVRAIFGIGARADLLTALLGSKLPNWSAPELVHVGYTRRNLAQILDDLAKAEVLRVRRERNQLRYEWQRRSELEALVRPLPAHVPRWPALMRLLIGMHCLLSSNCSTPALVAGINASKWLASHEQDLLGLSIALPHRSNQPVETWTRFQQWADALVDRAIQGTVG